MEIKNKRDLDIEFNALNKPSFSLFAAFNYATRMYNGVNCSTHFYNELFSNLTNSQKRFIAIALQGAEEKGYDGF